MEIPCHNWVKTSDLELSDGSLALNLSDDTFIIYHAGDTAPIHEMIPAITIKDDNEDEENEGDNGADDDVDEQVDDDGEDDGEGEDDDGDDLNETNNAVVTDPEEIEEVKVEDEDRVEPDDHDSHLSGAPGSDTTPEKPDRVAPGHDASIPTGSGLYTMAGFARRSQLFSDYEDGFTLDSVLDQSRGDGVAGLLSKTNTDKGSGHNSGIDAGTPKSAFRSSSAASIQRPRPLPPANV